MERLAFERLAFERSLLAFELRGDGDDEQHSMRIGSMYAMGKGTEKEMFEVLHYWKYSNILGTMYPV